MQTPFFRKKGKLDVLGGIFVTLIMALLVYVGVYFLSRVLRNYLLVEINKVYEPVQRAKEILSLLYLVVIALMTILTLERTRKVFADDKNRLAFLRLPLKKRNVFLSKFAVLSMHSFIIGLAFILTINIVLATIMPLGARFWLATVCVCIFVPIICLLLNALFIVPYIKIIEFLQNRYLVLFILFTLLLAVAFFAYSNILNVLQTLLTTGSIRFLFNEDLVATLQGLYIFCYPANSLVSILLEENAILSWLLLLLFTAVSVTVVFFISKTLYKITLYRQPKKSIKTAKPTKIKQRNSLTSLIIKEFICVFREPKYLFAYFSVATSMPIMVYCCFTLFQALIYNTIGVQISFALALSTVLIFAVLTNTFCSTNVTRDGFGILKMKTLPLSIYKILFAKVAFSAIISCLAVIVSCIILVIATPLTFLDGVICILIGLTFTVAQILIATKLDLTHAKISMSDIEVEDQSGKTLSKVVLLGGALTIVCCASCVFFALFASGLVALNDLTLLKVLTYLVPTLIGIIYLVCSALYFRLNLVKCFQKLTNK